MYCVTVCNHECMDWFCRITETNIIVFNCIVFKIEEACYIVLLCSINAY